MATEDINFMDLAVLLKVTPGMAMEKVGGMINTSFFDAANIVGGLKQKGLIEFSATFPGPTPLQVTESGKTLISDANTKSTEPFDKLDESILMQLSGGKRGPAEMQGALNIRSKDLALRIYKLTTQGFVNYELKNGNAYVMLTEQGFLRAKSEQKMTPPMQGQAMPMQGTMQPQMAMDPQGQPMMGGDPQAQQMAPRQGGGKGLWIGVAILIVIIVVAAVYYVFLAGSIKM